VEREHVERQLLEREQLVGQFLEREQLVGELLERQLLEREQLVRELVELMTMTKLPKRALVLIGSVIAAGAACLTLRLGELGSWRPADLAILASIAATTVVGERFDLKFRFGDQTKHVTVTEASFVAALLLGIRPSVLTAGVVAGAVASNALRRTPVHKAAFNVGSFALAVTAMEVAYRAAQPAGSLVAAAAGCASFFAVNASTVVGVIAAVERRSVASVFAPISRVELAHAAGNAAAGIVAAGVLQVSAAAAPLAILAGGACYAGYRLMARRTAGLLAA
jgi:hypothetical protein